MKRLALEKISVKFGEVEALKEVSVALSSGENCMLVGPNGAGKSTLLKVLLGLVYPESGTLLVDGVKRQSDNAFKEQLSYLPESVAFAESLTARQILDFFARAREVKKSRIDEVLERVGLSHASRRRVGGYSRGMRQRLGLATAILAEPPLLILDEPTGGLDQEGLSVLWSILSEWREKGRIVLMSTHDLALLERRVSHMCVLRSGNLLFAGTPDHLRETVPLPLSVYMDFDAEGAELSNFVRKLQDWEKSQVLRDGCHLEIEIAPDGLSDFLDIRGRYIQAKHAIRIQEPTLDNIYEKLLETQ